MSFGQTVILAAFAGGTIFIGLPVGRWRLSRRAQAILSTVAAGVILFLIYDVLSQAIGPASAALERSRGGAGPGEFGVDAVALAGGLAVGLLSVVYVTSRLARRSLGAAAVGVAGATISPRDVAAGTALGLGLHNFSEGLAIGQSAATGVTTLALILVIGFALHNATEGFAIAAPLSQGERPSWGFLAATGLIGGGPTFLGSLVGYSFVSPVLSILFLGLAAGALIYVFNEVMSMSRRLATPMTTATALLAGFLVALATDFILVAAGA